MRVRHPYAISRHLGIRPLRIFAGHGREKLRARASRPLRRNRFGDGRRRKQTTGTRKKPRRSAPVEGAIFFPSVVGSGKLVFCKPYRSKSVFAYVIGYGRGKSSFLAHVLGYGRGKNSRHPAAAPQKRNCVFSQLRTGKKFVFCTRYRLRTGKTTRSVGIFLALAFAGPRSAAVLPDRTQKICDGKRKHSNEKFFPTVLAYTFPSSRVEIRKGRVPICLCALSRATAKGFQAHGLCPGFGRADTGLSPG